MQSWQMIAGDNGNADASLIVSGDAQDHPAHPQLVVGVCGHELDRADCKKPQAISSTASPAGETRGRYRPSEEADRLNAGDRHRERGTITPAGSVAAPANSGLSPSGM